MLSLFTIPSASDLLASTSAYSTGFFTELLIPALVIVGILIAGMFARKLGTIIMRGVGKVIGGNRRSVRRRR